MEDYFALDEQETYALESDSEDDEDWKARRLYEKAQRLSEKLF